MAVGLDLKSKLGGNGEEPGSEIGSVREYMGMYHYDILKGGLVGCIESDYLSMDRALR